MTLTNIFFYAAIVFGFLAMISFFATLGALDKRVKLFAPVCVVIALGLFAAAQWV